MDAIKNITNRVSARELAKPYPTSEEMAIVYKGALRAPDHAWFCLLYTSDAADE